MSATPITQAMIAAQPGSFRILAPGDYYFAEPLHYPYTYGMAIQNEAPLGRVRIFGNGFPLDGVAYPDTQADGLVVFSTGVDLIDVTITGFRDNILLCEHGAWPGVGGQHLLSNVRSFAARQRGIHTFGHDNRYCNVTVMDIGGGANPYRPIGIQNVGARPSLSKTIVQGMIKGANNPETMNYHLDSCGSGGTMIDCEGVNYAKQAGMFGLWFNAPTGDLQMRGGKFGRVHTIFGGDLAGGELRTEAFDYDNGSNLVGPVVTVN